VQGEIHPAVVAIEGDPAGYDLVDVEFTGEGGIEELPGQLFDDAPAGDGDSDGQDRGRLGLGSGMEILGESGDDVGGRRQRGVCTQAVFQGVAPADGFACRRARSGGAERVTAAGGDLGRGAHEKSRGSEDCRGGRGRRGLGNLDGLSGAGCVLAGTKTAHVVEVSEAAVILAIGHRGGGGDADIGAVLAAVVLHGAADQFGAVGGIRFGARARDIAEIRRPVLIPEARVSQGLNHASLDARGAKSFPLHERDALNG